MDKKRLILYRRYEKIIVEELKNKGIKPNIYCINDDSRTAVAWAEAGLGIGIVPKSIIDRTNARVDIYEIDDEVLKTDICIVLLKNKYPSKSVRNLVDMIKNK
ncbi:LysR family transcriptional regulator substrate-binding protein [Intestinibacter sp.]